MHLRDIHRKQWVNQPELDETIVRLRDRAAQADLQYLQPLADHVLNDQKFKYWPASRQDKHHARVGGLAKHTDEVTEFFSDMRSASTSFDFQRPWIRMLPRRWTFIAGLFHDYGKTDEYDVAFDEEMEPGTGGWLLKLGKVELSHHGHLHSHVTGSVERLRGLISSCCAPLVAISYAAEIGDAVHMIHAHHGFKAWGSPIPPRTPDALILHQADMMSVFYDTGLTPMDRP